MGHYQLLAGGHVDEFNDTYHAQRGPKIVWSNLDLIKRFGADKFRKIDNIPRPIPPKIEMTSEQLVESKAFRPAGEPAAGAKKDLRSQYESMTVKELQQFAEDSGIDLTGVSKKDDIIASIMLHEEETANANNA